MSEKLSGKVEIQNTNGKTIIVLDSSNGNIYLGGNGQDGDLHVNDSLGNRTILLNGNQGNLSLGGQKVGGSKGTNGDIDLFTNLGTKTIHLSGQHGNIVLGGAKTDGNDGHDGDLIIKDRKGEDVIRLDGDTGEIKIKNWSLSVPDDVFLPEYRLRKLDEVKKYIKEYGHLPDVPSASEIDQKGFEMASFNMTLLRKIEELTLYILKQKEEINALKKILKK